MTRIRRQGSNDGTTIPEPKTPTRIILTPTEATLTAVRVTLQFTAAVLDPEGKAIQGVALIWTCSHPSVVNADEGG